MSPSSPNPVLFQHALHSKLIPDTPYASHPSTQRQPAYARQGSSLSVHSLHSATDDHNHHHDHHHDHHDHEADEYDGYGHGHQYQYEHDETAERGDNELGMEALRFRAMVEECTERLELLGQISGDFSRKRDQLAAKGQGQDVFSLMIKQKELEQQYELLMQKRNRLRGLANKKKYLANQNDIRELSEQLRRANATITNNLKDRPDIAGNLSKLSRDRQWLLALLSQTAQELHHHSFHHLAQRIGEEEWLLNELASLWAAQDEREKSVLLIERQAASEASDFQQARDAKQAQIQSLSNQIKQYSQSAKFTAQYERQQALAKMENLIHQRKQVLQSLSDRLAVVRRLQGEDELVATHAANFLNRQKEQLDQITDEWEVKYSNEVGRASEQLDTLKEARQHNAQILTTLQTRWQEDSEQKNALEAERKQRDKEEKVSEKLKHIMNLAQCKIRFAWRVYKRSKETQMKKKQKKARARRVRMIKEMQKKFPYLSKERVLEMIEKQKLQKINGGTSQPATARTVANE